jgi:class 3 adenylate cyclase
MKFAEIERLASNWFNPLLEEQRSDFRGAVQAILGEASSRGMVHSPPTYFVVEKRGQQEIEQRGRTMLDGYSRALKATPGIVSQEIIAQVKQKVDTSLLAEAEQVHSAIGYVRDAIKPGKSKTVTELRARPLQKLTADFDLFCAQLNTDRGVATFGWKPSSATVSMFAIYEQGQLSTPEAVQRLIQRMFVQPETQIRYYYQNHTTMEAPLVEAIEAGDILIKSWDFRYFKDPQNPHFYSKIRDGDYKADWQKEVAESTPEFVQATLELSVRKRTEMDTSKKVYLEDRVREQLKEQKRIQGSKESKLEIAHVLFIDIVGYSKLMTAEQRRLIDLLNQIVRKSECFRAADAEGGLIAIPTGDGMALVFYGTPEAPAECALEISNAAVEHSELKLRMGLHSGPVSDVVDINDRRNIAGAGINTAQRVMDCGDAGHILVSKHMAEDLEQYNDWKRHLHELGECEVKHGIRVSIVNLYTKHHGNPDVPEKLRKPLSPVWGVTYEQETKMLRILHTSPKSPVMVTWTKGDEQGSEYAIRLVHVLTKAGIQVGQCVLADSWLVPAGVSFWWVTNEINNRQVAKLRSAVTETNIESGEAPRHAIPSGMTQYEINIIIKSGRGTV